MKKIFTESQKLEKSVKSIYQVPDFLMMENAASALVKEILNFAQTKQNRIRLFIICGKGNNGADGLAVARMIHSTIPTLVFLPEEAKTSEAIAQKQMAKAVGVDFSDRDTFLDSLKLCSCGSEFPVFLDCLYGTGFRGTLCDEFSEFFAEINLLENCYKIACDIPSGFAFNADLTVTMGTLKTQLYSDYAKQACEKIITADLGFSAEDFEKCGVPDAFLIEKIDCKLPYRKNASSHKGNFGHASFVTGEKCGASILGAEAALNFGSGLVSLVKTADSIHSNIEQFKISPQLMIASSIPEKTTALEAGSGLGNLSENTKKMILKWAENTNNPALVLDADIFNYEDVEKFLDELNSISNIRLILTPHLKELEKLFTKCIKETSIKELQNAEAKIELGKAFCKKYKNITLIMKSACTFIAGENQIYICADGTQSLAKAGSGDVLAGMCTALLAQGYSAKDTAITAVEAHALAGKMLAGGAEDYSLTAEKLIENISNIIIPEN